MTLRIITGTIVKASDPWGGLYDLYKHGVFKKWVMTDDGWIMKDPGIIAFPRDGEVNIVQETGSGKTIIGMVDIFKSHIRGHDVGGNLKIQWAEINKGKKDKKYWQPSLNSIEDLEKISHIDIIVDDLYGTLEAWNCKEAKLLSVVALLARKGWVNIDITAQFLENMVPPNLRRVTGEFHVPFIRCEDSTRLAPDGKNFPLQIIDFSFTSNYQYKGYKVYDLTTNTGKRILNSFDTLEVSVGLKQIESGPRLNQPGYKLEVKAVDYLKSVLPFPDKVQHLNGKNVFDIITPTHAFDVVGKDFDGNLYNENKRWARHLGAARRTGKIPYLMFEYFDDSWGFIRIKSDLPEGRTLDLSVASNYRRIKRIDSLANS